MDDWWKEFENPVIPYASEFVEQRKRQEKLKHLNNILYETRSYIEFGVHVSQSSIFVKILTQFHI